MAKKSKLYRQQQKGLEAGAQYTLQSAIQKLKDMPQPKFDQTVDLSVRLGIDTRQSDQVVRGALPLPHGTGKQARIVVIATGDDVEACRSAGADEVGFEELLSRIEGGWLDFDVLIATPSTMQKVRTLGRALGPRGLMPNPKTGTLTSDPAAAVSEAKRGRVEYRADRGGCVHVPVGKVSFGESALQDNCMAVVDALLRARPATAKGDYVLSGTLSATMSPGVRLDTAELVRR